MPTYASGVKGDISGIIGDADTHAMKVERFQIRLQVQVSDVSGFGDAGESVYENGRRQYSFNAVGFLLTDDAPDLDASGNVATPVSTTFTCDTGKTFAGNAILDSITINEGYKTGTPVVAVTGRIVGAVTETWS